MKRYVIRKRVLKTEIAMKKFLFCSCLMLYASAAFPQEKLINLKYNPALFGKENEQGTVRDTGTERDTLCLPFFDDFSNLSAFLDSNSLLCNDTVYNTSPSKVYPNHLYWIDSSVYINQTYAYQPPTYGTATFDGLNKAGTPHNEALDYGLADALTSKPIFLRVTLVDTVYLSFYYQATGYGDSPETSDSLLLEFKDASGNWTHVWSVSILLAVSRQIFQLSCYQ